MLVLPLSKWHDRSGFDCGDVQLNVWFAQVAKQHKDKGVSSTFVVSASQTSTEVKGFYAITIAELISGDLPEKSRKRLPAKVPVFKLGRLATSQGHQGKGIGEFMLFDAIDRSSRIAMEVGGVGLVVDAKPTAVDFYRRYGFEPMADHPQHLFLAI